MTREPSTLGIPAIHALVSPEHAGPCPVCRGPMREQLAQREHSDLEIHICADCGYAVRITQSTTSFSVEQQMRVASTHSVTPFAKATRWPHRPALIASQINRLCPGKGNVLDIGCSNGANLMALGAGWTKYGVELNPMTARSAAAHLNAEVFCGRIEDYAPPISEFDVITAYALVEHLECPERLFQWAQAHLRTAGLFVLMTGDRESLTAQRMASRWPLYHCIDHFHYFSAKAIRMLALRNGFDIAREEWRYMYSWKKKSFPGIRRYYKLMELLGDIKRPVFDHYYCYMWKK